MNMKTNDHKFIETEPNRIVIDNTLALTIPEAHHLDGLDALLNHPSVADWLGGKRERETILKAIDSERRHWEQHGFGPWVALDLTTGAVIGRGGLRRADVLGRAEVELFYAVIPSMWKKGIATAIATSALELGFSSRGLDSVIVFTAEVNRASQRVIEKLGFSRETVFEHAGLPHLLFRLTKAEFQNG
jgi:RimJ/RimL family protein N-acetyltransferase